MKKPKIFLYHLMVFLIGSVGIVVYIFNRLASPSNGAGLGGAIAMPVIAFVYVVGFGFLCLISLVIWLLVAYFGNRRAR